MDEPSEFTIFEENNVTITNRRAIIASKAYEIADIISVNMTARGSQSSCTSLLLFPVAIFLLFGGALDGSGNKAALLPGLILVVLAFVMAAVGKPEFIVRIGMPLGKSNILYSKDKAHIQRVVGAINKAITLSGRSLVDSTAPLEAISNLWKSGPNGKLIIAGSVIIFWLSLVILGIFLRLGQ
jgi:hypothetical protein